MEETKVIDRGLLVLFFSWVLWVAGHPTLLKDTRTYFAALDQN